MERTLGQHDTASMTTPGAKNPSDMLFRTGVVKKTDAKTHVVTFDDPQNYESDLRGLMLYPLYNVVTKEGGINLPTPGTKIVYIKNGGQLCLIFGCMGGPLPIPGRKYTDPLQTHNGFESFVTLDQVGLAADKKIPYPSDFGHDEGDLGFVTQNGKIKLKNSGVLVLRSGDMCSDYMIPEAAHRMRFNLWDELRLPGISKLRRAFISGLNKEKCSASYEREDTQDDPVSPRYLVREEKGFLDNNTANQTANWTKPIEVSGSVGVARAVPQTVIRSSAVKRTKVYKTTSEGGQIVTKAPVYKHEIRTDGSVIEEVGSNTNGATYNLQITKSSTGTLQLFVSSQGTPMVSVEINAQGNVAVQANTKISLKAPVIELDGDTININSTTLNLATTSLSLATQGPLSLQSAQAVNIQSALGITMQAPVITVDGQTALQLQSEVATTLQGGIVAVQGVTALELDAPMINSLPTPAVIVPVVVPPVVTIPAAPIPLTPPSLMPNLDNVAET